MSHAYHDAVAFLESLQIMPKSMPGLEKIKRAVTETNWFHDIDPNKVIVVAGTNGKGSTSASLEALLIEAGQSVGFYSSPHLVSTTERMRVNSFDISEAHFVELFCKNEKIIRDFELSHFEALTLMAGSYFFDRDKPLDYIIFEVGLGGLYDATNVFPHKYSVITAIGYDHMSILGHTLDEIARNKFGIVGKKNIVVHHTLHKDLLPLKIEVAKATNSNWVEAEKAELRIIKTDKQRPRYFLSYDGVEVEMGLPGERAAENIMTAVTLFQIFGFDFRSASAGVKKINWKGRMQRLNLEGWPCDVYLSGDHNEQGVESLLKILADFSWENLHLVFGAGADKSVEAMLQKLVQLQNIKLYLTETTFKALPIEKYPDVFLKQSVLAEKKITTLLSVIRARAQPGDLCLITGSLYLVGEVLKLMPSK